MNCRKCGFKNPEGAKFCNQCGTPVATSQKRDRGQRRRVAVLFADISGFTPLSETLDPEEVRDLIDSCLQRLAGVIYKYEGHIDKFIGDCIMALFGAPVVHEDDPLRAVIASMNLQKEIKEFNKEKGLNFFLSIGINYGLVATGDLGRPGEYTVMGDVVNLAQRLQYAAPKGKIYVSESINKHTINEVTYKKLNKIKVKGKKEPVSVYEPQRVKRQYSLRKIRELPLVGRRGELDRLLKIFAEARTGHGQVISIIGEAGIGKSKLTYEFKKQIIDSAYIIEGRGIHYLSSSPYLVLKDILKSLMKIEETDTKESAVKKIDSFIKEARYSTLLKITPFLKYFLELTLSRNDCRRFESMRPKDRIRMINEAILTFLLRISNIMPLVIIFEDCHWIDPESINFMHRFAPEIHNKQIMLVNIYRPEFRISKETSRLSFFSQINLRPLSPDDTVTLLQDLLHCKKIEDKLFKLLIKKSGRIPFYIHELVSNLVNDNIIFVRDSIAMLKRGMESAVPRTLDELIMAKIDKLDNELRTIVDIAAVIGDEFSIKLLNTLLELDDKLKYNLSLLAERGIMLPLTTLKGTISCEEKYAFSHSLMTEAVYQSLLKQMRKEYHRQIGYAIECVYADDLSENYDAMAHHFVVAGEKAKAVEYLEKAGDHKQGLYLNDEAIGLYRQSLELIDKSQYAQVARIYEKLGKLHELIGDYEQAIDEYTEMGHFGKSDVIIIAKSLYVLAIIAGRQGTFDKSLDLLDKSRKTLKVVKKSSPLGVIQLANILSEECWIYRIKGKVVEAEKKGLEAISIIKKVRDWRDYENLKKALAKAYFNLAIVYVVIGTYEKAVMLCEDTLIIAEEIGNRHDVGSVYETLGTIYKEHGNYDKAIDFYAKKLKISQELGDKMGTGTAYGNLGTAYRNKGDYDKTIELYNNYLNISENMGQKQSVGTANNNLGIVYWSIGEYDKAIKSFKKSLSISEELDDKRLIASTYGNLGEVYATRLEFRKAINLFKKFLRMSNSLNDKKNIAGASFLLGAAYAKTGRLGEADKHLSKAKEIYKTMGNKYAMANVYFSLSTMYLEQKKMTDARDAAKMAMNLADEVNATDVRIKSLINIGIINHIEDALRTTKAKRFFKEAIKLGKNSKNKRLLADAYFEYAKVLKTGKKADKDSAKKNYTEALKLAKELKLSIRIAEITAFLKNKKS